MNWGDFRRVFKGVASKALTAHEVNPTVSNGHEFQGVNRLSQLLGTDRRDEMPATYMLLADDPEDDIIIRSTATWYDSRANDPSRPAEWRLYYPAAAGQIQSRMAVGDLMVIAVTPKDHALILLAPAGSGRAHQLRILFGLNDDPADRFSVQPFEQARPLDFLAAAILEELGIGKADGPAGTEGALVHSMASELVDEYPESLPAGVAVSALVRARVPGVSRTEDPDGALLKWMEIEAAVYRAWEDRKIERRLIVGFVSADGHADVEGFRKFAMFLRQSRVSRAGGALQYHFRDLLDARHIKYVMEPRVDGGEIPDFLFPGLEEYRDPGFEASRLRMLAAKHTAKDRWRQVLNEAERIWPKHLLTLDSGVSAAQLRLMSEGRLTLVMPAGIRDRYRPGEAARIIAVNDFIAEVARL